MLSTWHFEKLFKQISALLSLLHPFLCFVWVLFEEFTYTFSLSLSQSHSCSHSLRCKYTQENALISF